jgi:hypothetical protein
MAGRPVATDADVEARIRSLRADGQSFQAITDALNAVGAPTAHGGTWHKTTVARIWARLVRDGAA